MHEVYFLIMGEGKGKEQTKKTLTFCYFLEPCYFDGRLFRDGEDWSLGRCSKCVCRDGVTQCFTASCEAVLCKQVRTQQPSGDTTHDCLLSLGKINFSCKHTR